HRSSAKLAGAATPFAVSSWEFMRLLLAGGSFCPPLLYRNREPGTSKMPQWLRFSDAFPPSRFAEQAGLVYNVGHSSAAGRRKRLEKAAMRTAKLVEESAATGASELKRPRLFKFLLQLALGPAGFLTVCLLPMEGLPRAGHLVLATFAWALLWWVTQPVPFGITALLPLVIFPAMRILDVTAT